LPALAVPAVAAAALPAAIVAPTDIPATPVEPDTVSKEAFVARAEQMIETLRDAYVVEGWKLDEEYAARSLESICSFDWEDDGERPEIRVILEWTKLHGQSLDWLVCGDVSVMICKQAKPSAAAPKPDAKLIALGIPQRGDDPVIELVDRIVEMNSAWSKANAAWQPLEEQYFAWRRENEPADILDAGKAKQAAWLKSA
jgi:hypothetical protein